MKLLWVVVGCLLVCNTISSAYVIVYPGVSFYGDNITLSFKSATNLSYLEIGSNYFMLNNSNLSVSCNNPIDINVSDFNGSINLTNGEPVLCFNVTYTSGPVTFYYTGNHTKEVYDVFIDDVLTLDNEVSDSNGRIDFTISSWSTKAVKIRHGGYIPDPPYNGNSSFDSKLWQIDFNWTSGNWSNRDIVVRKNNSYPTSPSDGTVAGNYTVNTSNCHNESIGLTWINDTIAAGGNVNLYFTVWSWNETSNTFSTSGLNIPWGVLETWVWNESRPSQNIYPYRMVISNQDLTKNYEANVPSNPHIVNLLDIPYGEQSLFVINLTHDSWVFKQLNTYMDITVNSYHNLSFYLIPVNKSVSPGGGDSGGDTVASKLYLITVVGPQGEFTSPPVEDAKVEFRKYMNSTGTYETKATLYTDANGQIEIYLMPGDLYRVIVSKDGYITETADYIPSDSVSTHTFRILPGTTGDDEYDIFWQIVEFNAGLNTDNTTTVDYTDTSSNTVDTLIKYYESYDGVVTLLHTDNRSGEQSFSFIIPNTNASRSHIIKLWFNTTNNFDATSPIVLILFPTTFPHNSFDFEERVKNIVGPFVINDEVVPWISFIAVMFSIGLLVTVGPYNTGMGIMASGLALGMWHWIVALWFNPYNTLDTMLIVIIPLIILLGGLYYFTKNPEAHL